MGKCVYGRCGAWLDECTYPGRCVSQQPGANGLICKTDRGGPVVECRYCNCFGYDRHDEDKPTCQACQGHGEHPAEKGD